MLIKPKEGQSMFVEITNKIHGGNGWEFGTCLWSPVKDKRGGNAWLLMKDVKPGDIIIHLLRINNHYNWVGVSIAESYATEIKDEPPSPDRWKDMYPYYRIPISNFIRTPKNIVVDNIFNDYEKELKDINYKYKKGLFYVQYGINKKLRVGERYIAIMPLELYSIFNNISDTIDFDYNPDYSNYELPTNNEPAYPDIAKPSRILSYITRIVRDTKMVRELKIKYNWFCQICGKRIALPNSSYFAEGHHLIPLGGEFNGPDIKENIIIVCPFHHAEFDYGSIAINPENGKIEHINKDYEFNGLQSSYKREDL